MLILYISIVLLQYSEISPKGDSLKSALEDWEAEQEPGRRNQHLQEHPIGRNSFSTRAPLHVSAMTICCLMDRSLKPLSSQYRVNVHIWRKSQASLPLVAKLPLASVEAESHPLQSRSKRPRFTQYCSSESS